MRNIFDISLFSNDIYIFKDERINCFKETFWFMLKYAKIKYISYRLLYNRLGMKFYFYAQNYKK